MTKTFLKLFVAFTFFLMFITPVVVKSGGGGGGGGKGPGGGGKSPLPVCPTLTNINFTINSLAFFPYSGMTTTVPFEHTNSVGTNNPNDATKYYCKITIEPMIDANCFNPSSYTFYWIQPGNSIVIQRPSGIVCKLTIEYYEKCAFYDNGQARSRRYWKYSTTITTSQDFATGQMQFVTKIFGC